MVGKHGSPGAAGAVMGELLDQVMPMKILSPSTSARGCTP